MTGGGRRVRRPTPDDLDDVFRIHGDPRTDRFDPAGPEAGRARLDAGRRPDLEHGVDGLRAVVSSKGGNRSPSAPPGA